MEEYYNIIKFYKEEGADYLNEISKLQQST